MWKPLVTIVLLAGALAHPCAAHEEHVHPAPEQLGKVDFPISCDAAVAPQFQRAIALLHSFAYADAQRAFRDVVAGDAQCPIARWGIAMSLYHPLWEPPNAADLREGAHQLELARRDPHGSPREHRFIAALDAYYRDTDTKSASERARLYAAQMGAAAQRDPHDVELQIFHALALLGTAPASDKTHANQKQAIAILEPIYRKYPQHPGLAHYLIHACDSAELAKHGLAAARAYSKIAPSAPHALHMPSHIFTRLGLWDDSIASNLAARSAAREQGDVGEELHAMDYLTYAYLQRRRVEEAQRVVDDLRAMPQLAVAQFKVGYAVNVMPVRVAVEQQAWRDAAALQPVPAAAPHVAAVVHWARALGAARSGDTQAAEQAIDTLEDDLRDTRAAGNAYWAGQVEILLREAQAWCLAANGARDEALTRLRAAADQEDAVEKLPVTPGPVIPAREQLARMLLDAGQARAALREYRVALSAAPRRRAALEGAIAAAQALDDREAVRQLRAELAGADAGVH